MPQPTMHFRWAVFDAFEPFGSHGLQLRKEQRVLQQFWEVFDNDSSITLPREMGPTGHLGHWYDVPEWAPQRGMSHEQCAAVALEKGNTGE